MLNFKKLDVWQLSMNLTKLIYSTTRNFPKDEIFGITSQLRRCSVSISSNIADGSSRRSNKDFVRFLEISLGSAFEIETQILVCKDVEFITKENQKRLKI